MSSIIVHQRRIWTQQPGIIAGVNGEYGLTNLMFPASKKFDSVRKKEVESGEGAVTYTAGKYGPAFNFNSSEVLKWIEFDASSSRYSIIAVVKPEQVGTWMQLLSLVGSGHRVQLRSTASNWEFYHNSVSGWVAATLPFVDNVDAVIICRWDGSNLRLMVNGVSSAPTAASSWYASDAPNKAIIGADSLYGTTSDGTRFKGKIYAAGLAAQTYWSDDVARSLCENPWKLFEQRSRYVFVEAGSSNTYTLSPGGSFTFSGSSSVIKTKQYSPSGSVTFSGTAAELKTKIQVPSGNITYSGTASLTLTNGSTTYTITPSGTITFSGTTDYVKERVVYPIGSITYNGSALELKTRSFVPTGNITFSGNNTEYRTKILAPTGLITFQGSAPITGPGGLTGATMTKLPMTGAGK